MEKQCKFSYNEIDDSLIISCRGENKKAKENFMFDDLIFYLTENGKIIGLQIRSASSILEESGINPSTLDNLKSANLIINPKQNSLFIGVNLISDIKETKLPIGRIFAPQLTI